MVFNKYDWWCFSKIDESLDQVSIPYYDTKEQKYRDFFPDFIFWLKKNDMYFIKFIDPKGSEIGLRNARIKPMVMKNHLKILNSSTMITKYKLIYFSTTIQPVLKNLQIITQKTLIKYSVNKQPIT